MNAKYSPFPISTLKEIFGHTIDERRKMLLEALENRQFLTVMVDDSVLIIRGTKGADEIRVSAHSDLTGHTVRVKINGQRTIWASPKHFPAAGPDLVEIYGGKGHDYIQYATTTFPAIRPVHVSGGSGNDEIRVLGPRRIARVDGGPGDDTITASPGNGDTLIGGSGDDLIQTYTPHLKPDDPRYVARLGEPTGFEGRRGSILSGGDGDDTLVGSIFNDRLAGGPGKDALFGDDGKDTLKGGAGNDCYMKNFGDACAPKKKKGRP